MVTTFDAQFARSGFPILLRQFGEPIVYWPASGGSRTVDAIVEREPRGILDVSGNAVFPTVIVRVYNSCRLGISSRKVNVGADEIELPLKVGDVRRKRMSLMVLQSQDSGVTVLACT